MMYQLMGLIANALTMCDMQPGDIHKVSVAWRGRGKQATFRVKVGIYTVRWRLEL